MYSNIVVAIDLAHGDIGEHILKLARHVGGSDARITALHVMDDVPAFIEAQIPDEVVSTHHNDVRDRLAALVRSTDPDARVAIRKGSPGNAILEEAEKIGADAIVLGSHRPDFRDYLIGSTAARVVRHAPCSVIVDREKI